MKILMLTPYLPYPPSSGGNIRSFNLIKHLSKTNKIVLVSLIKDEKEKEYMKYLEPYCERVYTCKRSKVPWTFSNISRSILGRQPFLVVRNFSLEAKKIIKELLDEPFDLIHAETFYIMPHIPPTKVPILLVEQTIEYLVYEKFVKEKPFFFKPLLLEVLKLKLWERIYWKKADLVATVSDTDREKILALAPNLHVEIIPNAAGEDLIDLYKEKKNIQKPIFLFQGNFFWLQNVEAAQILAKSIFPLIKKEFPRAECVIAGQKAEEKIGELIKYGVTVVDMEADDIAKVREVYRKATIFIAPIEGPGGTRLKILGAMASGLPVISSIVGVTGLAVKDGRDVLIANDPYDYVKKTRQIIDNPQLYHDIRAKARTLIETTYNWKSISRKLETIYLQLIKSHEDSH